MHWGTAEAYTYTLGPESFKLHPGWTLLHKTWAHYGCLLSTTPIQYDLAVVVGQHTKPSLLASDLFSHLPADDLLLCATLLMLYTNLLCVSAMRHLHPSPNTSFRASVYVALTLIRPVVAVYAFT
eukprot:55841-Eustigmatos_ZCMA.PRE.1